ncbi:MAG: pyridoxal 5'-phosphate synthase glutaminase subunit PdxT [Candidatus Nanopelagicaceae bacterium]|nr:pyridoxal 5'-phosphate synthase glutaminase subunit PdxT [Candidatus Nanopelagicaceae bacterium]
MRVGVLALQGDFREHIAALSAIGVEAIAVKTAEEINSVDALVLPGGESTTIAKLARIFEVFDLIKQKIKDGLPVYGSCAGLILLSNKILDGIEGQETFGGLNVIARRNAFGRQVDSFEGEIDFKGVGKLNSVFIRAPWVEEVGTEVEVLASSHGHPVAVRQGKILATSFHPELTDNHAVHRYFVEEICKAR